MCNPVDDSLPEPAPLALANVVLNSSDEDSPFPEDEAVLIDVCNPTAVSPAVDEPEPCAVLKFPCTVELLDEPVPEPVAVLGAVWRASTSDSPFPEPVTLRGEMIRRIADSEPCPLPVAGRGDVWRPSASEPLVPEPEADEIAVLTFVEVSLELPSPVALRIRPRMYETDDVPLPEDTAVLVET